MNNLLVKGCRSADSSTMEPRVDDASVYARKGHSQELSEVRRRPQPKG